MTRLICILLLTIGCTAQAQNLRNIIPIEFAKTRPAKGPTPPPRRTVYRRTSTQVITSTKPDELSQLGLTIWRLRPAKQADTGARMIVQKSSESAEYIPERVPANAPLHIGENIRFSFESPHTGYLYVIDRELYADGTMSEPMLIFPTTRTRGGANKVEAGKLIEIPAQEDRPNYFTLQATRLTNVAQTGEVLTVIVAPQPLGGLTIGADALALTNQQVKQWEQQWSAQSETLDLTGGAGQAWTKAEQEAGASSMRYLTQADPEPQTIYRVAARPGQPLLVKVGLRYSKSTRRKNVR